MLDFHMCSVYTLQFWLGNVSISEKLEQSCPFQFFKEILEVKDQVLFWADGYTKHNFLMLPSSDKI